MKEQTERIVTLSVGLLLKIPHCQAVTVSGYVLLLHSTLPQSIVCRVLYVLLLGYAYQQ
jgi:hypothetical protein